MKCSMQFLGIVVVSFVLVLTGCSSKPGANYAQEYFETKFASDGLPFLEVVSAARTSNEEMEMGVKMYKMGFRIKGRVTEDVQPTANQQQAMNKLRLKFDDQEGIDVRDINAFKAGDTFTIEGDMKFEKWKGGDWKKVSSW